MQSPKAVVPYLQVCIPYQRVHQATCLNKQNLYTLHNILPCFDIIMRHCEQKIKSPYVGKAHFVHVLEKFIHLDKTGKLIKCNISKNAKLSLFLELKGAARYEKVYSNVIGSCDACMHGRMWRERYYEKARKIR
jgi:hypothetical protein